MHAVPSSTLHLLFYLSLSVTIWHIKEGMFRYFLSITIIAFSIESLTKASEHEVENYRVGKQLNDLTQEDQALIDGKISMTFPTMRVVIV